MSNPTAKPTRINRTKAISILQGLTGNQLFGVTFVARGDTSGGLDPYLRSMSCKLSSSVTKHRMGGDRGYESEDHALFPVFEVLNRTTAVKRYKQGAQHELDEAEPKLQPAIDALAAARKDLADKGGPEAKGTKGRVKTVGVKERQLEAIQHKIALAKLKLADHVAAIRQEIAESLERRRAELAELSGKTPTVEVSLEIKKVQGGIDKELEYQADPEQRLLQRYRQINLLGLTELRVDGTTYKVTTAPTPPLPVDATVHEDDK